MKLINTIEISVLKKIFKQGTKVELIYMSDKQAPPVGTLGTVYSVDDMGTIHVKWENGSTLGLIYGEDKFKIIK